ncbi:hypothetical protein V8D89_002910 [Ganoderma adspersum]
MFCVRAGATHGWDGMENSPEQQRSLSTMMAAITNDAGGWTPEFYWWRATMDVQDSFCAIGACFQPAAAWSDQCLKVSERRVANQIVTQVQALVSAPPRLGIKYSDLLHTLCATFEQGVAVIGGLLNSSAPIHCMPLELLTKIFALSPRAITHGACHEHAYWPFKTEVNVGDLHKLTKVCRHWRDLAIAAPILWTTLGTRRRVEHNPTSDYFWSSKYLPANSSLELIIHFNPRSGRTEKMVEFMLERAPSIQQIHALLLQWRSSQAPGTHTEGLRVEMSLAQSLPETFSNVKVLSLIPDDNTWFYPVIHQLHRYLAVIDLNTPQSGKSEGAMVRHKQEHDKTGENGRSRKEGEETREKGIGMRREVIVQARADPLPQSTTSAPSRSRGDRRVNIPHPALDVLWIFVHLDEEIASLEAMLAKCAALGFPICCVIVHHRFAADSTALTCLQALDVEEVILTESENSDTLREVDWVVRFPDRFSLPAAIHRDWPTMWYHNNNLKANDYQDDEDSEESE